MAIVKSELNDDYDPDAGEWDATDEADQLKYSWLLAGRVVEELKPWWPACHACLKQDFIDNALSAAFRMIANDVRAGKEAKLEYIGTLQWQYDRHNNNGTVVLK